MNGKAGCVLRLLLAFILIGLAPTASAEGGRIAYIVEQLEYTIDGRTVTRESHAKSIVAALRNLGFTVQHYKNLSTATIEPALQDIANDSKGTEAAILYVAGLVLEKNGTGGVLPIDVNSADPASHGVPMSRLLTLPKAQDLRLVIIDSPQDARQVLSLPSSEQISPYLSMPETIPSNVIGTLTARAPFGGYSELKLLENSEYFARSFARFLKPKGRGMRATLNKMAISVFYDSQYQQFPHVFGKLDKEYLLVRTNEVSDITAWLELLAKPTAEGLKTFIETYPDSIYVAFARKQLEALGKQ